MAVQKATTMDDVKSDKPKVEGYVTLVSQLGHKTTVPESIVEALKDSGYIEE